MDVAQVDRCVVDGCVEPAYSRSYCRAHYERLRKNGNVGQARRLKAHWGEGNRRPDGYAKVTRPSHPLAARDGRVYAHRMALYDQIGAGPHECEWCGRQVEWLGGSWSTRLVVDHLNFDPTDDRPENLAPSCHHCNSGRTRRWTA